MRIFIKVVYAVRIERRRTAFNAVDLITLVKQKLG
jgi:hypothetical protein